LNRPGRGKRIVLTAPIPGLLLIYAIYLAATGTLPVPCIDYGYGGQDRIREMWVAWARKAWEYFQPGKGLEASTGLHHAGLHWPYFTEWDLGVYIQAVIDAEKIGILPTGGPWGANERIDKIISFLENRDLTPDGLPYLWYDSRTGKRHGDTPTNPSDAGKLLVALRNLKLHRPDLASKIDWVVKVRTNYARIASDKTAWSSTGGLYAYYVAHGFSFFGYDRYAPVADALATLDRLLSGSTVETYGVKLPVGSITTEPILHMMFELEPEPHISYLARLVYLAHEGRYNATGKYTAFSEGNTDLSDPSYVYEWVVTSSGEVWKITDHKGRVSSITPIIYLKTAVGFHALYGTRFTASMVEWINSTFPDHTYGYRDGVDENRRLVGTIIDKTNGLVIAAARYAVSNLDLSKCLPYVDGYSNLILLGSTDVNLASSNNYLTWRERGRPLPPGLFIRRG
jgi:hypothetical protein